MRNPTANTAIPYTLVILGSVVCDEGPCRGFEARSSVANDAPQDDKCTATPRRNQAIRDCSWRIAFAAALLGLLVTAATAAPLKVARLKYAGGGDWYANPTGLPNLLKAVRQRTTIDVNPTEDTITLDDDRVFDYAAVFVTGHGQIKLTPPEAQRLRRYLLGGGFMHVDDNYGLDESFRKTIKLVFPDRALVELPFTHPLYHSPYPFPQGLPKIHEHHGGPPHGYGLLDKGRVVLFYSYNTDINDGWESPEVHKDPPERREAALRMGINILVYALTH